MMKAMSPRCWSFTLTAMLVVAGCGRIGYDVSESRVVSGNDTLPFGDAAMTGMAAFGGNARLDRVPTFVVLPERLPSGVANPAVCPEDKTVYVGGGSSGQLSRSNCTRDVLIYENDGSMLTLTDELPITNQGFGLVSAGGAMYSVMGLCGGGDTDERSVFRHLDGSAPPELVGMFEEGTYYQATGVVPDAAGEDTIIVAGGYGSGPLRDSIQTMDPDDGSARILDIPLPSLRCLSASTTIGDTFYVIGGSTYVDCDPPATNSALEMADEILAIRLAPDAMNIVGTLPEPLAGSCAITRADGTIAIMGGLRYADDGSGGYQREASEAVYIFDPGTGAVTTHAAVLPTPRSQMGCARTGDDRQLVFGGAASDGSTLDEILLFEPHFTSGTMSGVLDASSAGVRWNRLTAEANAPDGTSIRYALRTADDMASLGAADWIEVTPGALPGLLEAGRYVEWRVTMQTADVTVTPTLHRLELAFGAG